MSRLDEVLGTALLKGKEARERTRLRVAQLALRPQPRRRFDGASLEALAHSVKAHGVLEPLLVRPIGEGRYEVVAGERRLRAAQLAGLTEVPVVVLEGLGDKEAQAIALMENLQREDLNPFEETVGILDLLALELGKEKEEVVALLHRMRNEAKGKVTQSVLGNPEAERVEEAFRRLGRMGWESFVQTRLPLLHLPEDLKEALLEGSIPYTAALELKKVKDPSLRQALLSEAKAGLPLRELKARVREALKRTSPPTPYRDLLRRLARLDLKGLPPDRRERVEGYLEALMRELEGEG